MAESRFFIRRYYERFRSGLEVIRILLDRQSAIQLIWSLLLGVIGFFSEIGLAVALNAILVFIGLVNVEKLPEIIRSIDLSGSWVVVMSCGVVALRAGALFGKQMISGLIYWDFRQTYNQKIASAAIEDKTLSPMSAAYVTSMVTTGIPRAANVIRGLSEVVLGVIMVVPLFGSLLYLDVQLTALSFAGVAVIAASAMVLNRYVLKLGVAVNSMAMAFSEQYLRAIRNRILLRIYGTTEQETYECAQINATLRDRMASIVKLSAATPTATNLVVPIWLFIVVWIAVRHMTVEPAVLLSFFYLFLRFGMNISGLSSSFSVVLAEWPAAREIAESSWVSQVVPESGQRGPQANDESPHICDTRLNETGLRKAETFSKGVRIEARSLSAAYSGKVVFKGIDFELPPGQCLGLVGSSGSGKSTLISLIAGLLEPVAGRVKIDGLRPNNDEFSDLRRRIGYIGPEPQIKQGTIYENLIYGLSLPVTPEACVEVLGKVHLQEFSGAGRNGMERMIYEGGEGLSAGQKQRICLARALLREPRLLILDESTANLDKETEAAIIRSLRQLKGLVTMIVASHKSEPLTLADQIINLDGTDLEMSNSSEEVRE